MAIMFVNCSLDAVTKSEMQHYLRCRAPQWKDVPIVTAAKYLGFFVGPGAHGRSRKDAVSSWINATQM
eukprot:5474121-Karenia_brevis.AAC.1